MAGPDIERNTCFNPIQVIMVKQPSSTPQFPLRPFAIAIILKLYLSSDNAIARSAISHKLEHFQVGSLKKQRVKSSIAPSCSACLGVQKMAANRLQVD